MKTKAKKQSRLTQELLEMADGMHEIGLLTDAAYNKITMRHLGEARVATAEPLSAEDIRAMRVDQQSSGDHLTSRECRREIYGDSLVLQVTSNQKAVRIVRGEGYFDESVGYRLVQPPSDTLGGHRVLRQGGVQFQTDLPDPPRRVVIDDVEPQAPVDDAVDQYSSFLDA